MAEEVKVTEKLEATPKVEQPTAAQEASKETTPAQVNQPFKAFATEEEFNNFVKSTSSKAKHSILQALETNSVDEGKQKMSQAEQLAEDLQKTVTRLNQLEEENAVVRLGINEEFRSEALTLAKAKVDESTNLEAALAEVTKKFPNLLKGTQLQGDKIEKVGGDKAPAKKTEGADTVKANLKKKYP